MNLLHEIRTAEKLYRQKLENFFRTVYKDSNLYSHGLDHHKRVWNYSRELISYPEIAGPVNGSSFVRKLLIASYLHDSGMSVDPGPRHGHHSRNLCEQFLINNDLIVNDFTDLLYAVENHDIKDYPAGYNEPPILRILSVADDLDAFGYTGIYRYLEIYLVRDIPLTDIGKEILINADNRLRHMRVVLEKAPPLLIKYTESYKNLESFFNAYNTQLESYRFDRRNIAGYCGIAELIAESIKRKTGIEYLFETAEKESNDQIIKHLFHELRKELEPSD